LNGDNLNTSNALSLETKNRLLNSYINYAKNMGRKIRPFYRCT